MGEETKMNTDLRALVPVSGAVVPEHPGSYVCWIDSARFPVILGWSGFSSEWRYGATKVRVLAYIGPLPEVKR